ncbi:MAG: (d)CMP kinase [Alphaproteobacteria bacterium]|nr:(d)CMP kinase [Alphaproteobacteria bacterium]
MIWGRRLNKPIIAIDGPAASGKGTLARNIAEQLGFAHMDTGMLYRAVAFLLLESGHKASDETAAIAAAGALGAQFAASPQDILHNTKLREEKVTAGASLVAAMGEVRRVLFDMQRNFALNPGPLHKGAVLDGRDIGTVICPEADVKLFITASPEARAQRRLKELQSRGIAATYDAVLRDMRERDARDAGRQSAPMKAADDAVTLDTTELDQREALEKALAIVKEKLPA